MSNVPPSLPMNLYDFSPPGHRLPEPPKNQVQMRIEPLETPNNSKTLVPNAPSPVVRNTLVVFLFQVLHCIIQKEVNQNSVDSVCLRWLFSLGFLDFGLGLRVLWSVFLGRSEDAFVSSILHFWVTLLDLPLYKLNTPDARAAEFDFPV